jgi:hypothetical protein
MAPPDVIPGSRITRSSPGRHGIALFFDRNCGVGLPRPLKSRIIRGNRSRKRRFQFKSLRGRSTMEIPIYNPTQRRTAKASYSPSHSK